MEDRLSGLTLKEVEDRTSQGLVNKKNNKKEYKYLKIIYKNVFTFFNILLIIIGAILIYFNKITSCAFLVILLCNLGIGLFQDIRSAKNVEKLSLLSRDKVKVIREGNKSEIESESLVVGDLIFLTTGDQVPCDSVVVDGEANINESILTGESNDVKKGYNSDLLSGTYLTGGSIYARILKVGKDNYIEKLQAKSKTFKQSQSLMYIQLNRLFKVLSTIVIIFGILNILEFFLLGQENQSLDFISNIKENIITPLAGALISMIPSGMYLLTSTSLSVGVLSLSKKDVLVQDMYSIETLARVDTICIDKTGTITDGTMAVKFFDLLTDEYSENYFKEMMANYLKAQNDFNFTSVALKKYFGELSSIEALKVFPFTSAKKFGAVRFKSNITMYLGAFEFLNIENKDVEQKIKDYSSKGYRVLCVGFSSDEYQEKPSNIKPIGLILIQDNIRKDAPEIIKWFNDNHVVVKVISGDNPLTVSEIAREVGIVGYQDCISLDGMNDAQVRDAALKYNCFGRVTPYQKEIIIEELKKNKKTVAMFGDGVNDILALKQANVSITIKNATNSVKNIANIILLDNDFSKIPEVISQGRRVINNLQRTCSLFLGKTTFSILLNSFFLIFGIFTYFHSGKTMLWPFSPNNFYCWEVFAIGIGAFLLSLEPNNEQVKGDFLTNIFKKALPFGGVMGLIVIVLYISTYGSGLAPKEIATIVTYFLAIASWLVLLRTCGKMNMYRIIVCIICLLGNALFVLISIFGINILDIYGSTAPRILSNESLNILLKISGIELLFILFTYLFKGEKLYEKH